MTEPNKIPKSAPEDYHPKKPEILNIAEAAKGNRQIRARLAKSGAYTARRMKPGH
jgi:hypothetical protein